MSVLDTNMIIKKARAQEKISENITGITQVEYPSILEYDKFHGEIVYPSESDIDLASSIQAKLKRVGKTKSAQDLIIAAICINRNETLITNDEDFKDIAANSRLKVRFE